MKTTFTHIFLAILCTCMLSCTSKSPLLKEPTIKINDNLQQIVSEEVLSQLNKSEDDWGCAVLINSKGQLVAAFNTDSIDHISEQRPLGTILMPFALLAISRNALPKEDFVGELSLSKVIASSDRSEAWQMLLKAFSDNPTRFSQYMNEMGIDTDQQNIWSLGENGYRSLGHDWCTTPLHTAWLYHCLANGLFPQEWSVQTSGVLKGLHDCVNDPDNGTAFASPWGELMAYSTKVHMFGKTGAISIDEEKRDYLVFFVGCFPENDPEYTCLVMFNSPKSPFYSSAGMACGATVRKIAEKIIK